MRVIYYQYDGRSYLVCVRGAAPTGASPIWFGCNACSWMVPGTDV